MDKIAIYKEEIYKEAAIDKKYKPMKALKDDLKNKGLSDEEYNKLVNKLKTDYKVDADFIHSPKVIKGVGSLYMPKKHTKSGLTRAMYGIKGASGKRGAIKTIPVEEVMVHESGHALDKNLDSNSKKSMRHSIASNVSGIGGQLASSTMKNKKMALAAGVAGTAAAGYFANKSGKIREENEDRANSFVKKYYTDKYNGDVNKANEAISKTNIENNRNTYKKGTRNGTLQAVISNGAGVALNAYRRR